MKWKIASASARGSSHVRSGRPNQDACEHGTGSQTGPLKAVLAVSDGHGGARHFRSEIGSRLAAHIAISVMQESALATLPDDAVQSLTRKMVDDWRTAVLSDLEQHPITPEEWTALEGTEGSAAKVSVEEDPVLAYGATLLVVAAAETFMLYLQLGDGDILAVDTSGKTYRPIASDDRLVGNQTTSLCQPEAWKEFRSTVVRDPDEFAVVVLASTDGYANSFRSEEDFLKIGRDYLNLVREDGLDSLAEDLPAILTEASEKGSGDDITLSVLVSDGAYAIPAPVLAESDPVPTAEEPARPAAVNATGGHPVPHASGAPPQRPRFSAGQIRVMVLVAIILVGAILVQHFRPKSSSVLSATPKGNPVGAPAPAAAPPKKAGNAPPHGKEWALQFGAGSAIPLRPGTTLNTKELFHTPDSVPYAQVTDDGGVLRLMNLTDDLWTEERTGKQVKPVHNGEGVELGSGLKLILRAKTATVALADAPEAKSN